jgi:hypothetical protein
VLENNPHLRAFLQPGRPLKPRSLQAKYRRMLKQGKIPGEILNPGPPAFELTSGALDDAVKVYTFNDPVIRAFDPTSFFRFIRDALITLLTEHPNYKVYTVLRCEMLRTDADTGATTVQEMRFFSRTREIILGMDLPGFLDGIIVKGILTNFSERQSEGSGWRLGHIATFVSSYDQFHLLPLFRKSLRTVLLKNTLLQLS